MAVGAVTAVREHLEEHYDVGEAFHYTAIAEGTGLAEGTVSNVLSLLVEIGEVENVRRGQYAVREQDEQAPLRVLRRDRLGEIALVEDPQGRAFRLVEVDLLSAPLVERPEEIVPVIDAR